MRVKPSMPSRNRTIPVVHYFGDRPFAACSRLAAGSTMFRPGDHILELNCGTGRDALFLAARGISVTACDASARMIERAHMRKAAEAPSANAAFHLLSTESLHQLPSRLRFDGVFSNFSGLNCVKDLAALAENLALRLEAGAPLVLCFSTRFCIWEILHYLFRANPDKAFRRCRGSSEAHLGDRSFPVYYRTVRSILKSLRPMFRLRSVTGIGIAVPPSYMEHWAASILACSAFARLPIACYAVALPSGCWAITCCCIWKECNHGRPAVWNG